MRIDNTLPPFYTSFPRAAPSAERYFSRGTPEPQVNNQSRPGVVVDISPEGWAAYARSKALEQGAAAPKSEAVSPVCETCQSRKYMDVSNDPSVSFQTPTHISPGQSASMVRAHENEHVANEQAKADRDGGRVVSQSVTIQTSICPECKRVYVSGGVTRTITTQGKAPEASGNENNVPPEL